MSENIIDGKERKIAGGSQMVTSQLTITAGLI
jgi:hypothetical protein